MEVPIELCTSAHVYKPDPIRKTVLLIIIVILYALSIPYCYLTAGEPRRLAMQQAQQLADEKWALESASLNNSTNINNTEDMEDEISSTIEMTGELSFNNNNFNEEVYDEFEDDSTFEDYQFDVSSNKKANTANTASTTDSGSNGASWFAGWFGPTKEQKRAKADFERWQKEFKEKSGETVALPPEYLPSAWACLALFATLTIHALFHLMCHWVVKFKALMLYKPADKIEDSYSVLVVPPPNRGNAALVTITVPTVGSKREKQLNDTKNSNSTPLQIEFQRQKYKYIPPSKLGTEGAKKFPIGVFALTAYPIALPLRHYFETSGIKNEADIDRLVADWGKNHVAVAIPSFLEMLQSQLLSPLAIFQVFCALLWLLDEYWSYTVFTLISVVIFEATTVFQRSRTQKMLGGMAPKPSPIYAFRCNRWVVITTKDLLPGDLISLSYKKRASRKKKVTTVTTTANNNDNNDDNESGSIPATSMDDIIPCDCLILRGSAVVNEASLTGESVPQMKEAVVGNATNTVPVGDDEVQSSPTNNIEEERLDMNGINRVNTLFSGCNLITVDGTRDSSRGNSSNAKQSSTLLPHIPIAPDGGALAYVLRTGFGSSQGSLLQMIEFSQQSVSGDNRETGLALLLLFIFALIASGYVLYDGLQKNEKTQHELLLKCVIIITSVVPRQFPMQMAMAVNMALMALNKAGIFCTEPYRVPLAGKVSHCLFDKTGTLTTDQLVPVGIVNLTADVSTESSSDGNNNLPELCPVITATGQTAMILAACHSLVVVDDNNNENSTGAPTEGTEDEYTSAATTAEHLTTANIVGDPIELAAIKAIDWSWNAKTSTATPDGALKRNRLALNIASDQLRRLESLPNDRRPAPTVYKSRIDNLKKEIDTLTKKMKDSEDKSKNAMFSAVQVLQRHHFSSKLQRMSVVCRCSSANASGGSSSSDSWYCLVKGSPEALKQLMVPSAVPSWYTDCYESMARRGLRVLALGYRKVSLKDSPAEQPRSWVESELQFGGFIAFECKIRADSAVVMKALVQSDHKVSMLTGDALLTSLHVAKQTGICKSDLPVLTLTTNENDTNKIITWTERNEDTGEITTIPFDINTITQLSSKYNLLTTEKSFLSACDSTGNNNNKGKRKLEKNQKLADLSPMWNYAGNFCVFARMSPQGKASIIQAIQDKNSDYHVFMCGDGGNDVGALKQADVGLALLAGHANANTTEEIDSASTPASQQQVTNSDKSAEDALNLHQKKVQARNEAVNKARAAHMKEWQKQYTAKQQQELQKEIQRRTEAGDYMALWTVMKEQAAQTKQAINEENMRFMRMHGQVWDPKKDGDGTDGSKTGIEKMMESMDAGDAGGLPMVRPGDASVAAPFTSRIPSVRAVVDLIRQGRCTLLSALMQQQIMMLESTIAAYTLSALSLHNARSSERQMMASSWLIMTAAVSFSYASPLDHMHPLRPLRSLFHPAIFISTLGQAAIHIACMTLAVQWATDAMGPETLKEVTEFFKKAKANEIDRDAHCGEDDFMCQMQAYWTAPFMPNLLNSVVFLVETSQMISVFFANYKGRPWMKGMLENHPLFLSVFACIAGVAIAAWEMIPQVNELLQLAPFPDDFFRYKVILLVCSTILGTFLWDRLCVFLFAPAVFKASLGEFSKTSYKDFVPILMTLAKVVVGVILLGTGNILLIGGAIWWYRNYTIKQKENEMKKLGI